MKPILPTYLSRQAASWITCSESVSPGLGIGVVIPCYDEPGLLTCLRSLFTAKLPACDVEVLVVVNAPVNAAPESLARNEQTLAELKDFAGKVNNKRFRILFLNRILESGKYAGVGLARRIGMDEMIHRFNSINNAQGLIVSLDADCVVSAGYFVEIENHLYRNKKAVAATLDFEHPLPDPTEDPALCKAMIQYELYLRYYKHALKYTGFPYAYYTIGSAFAVKAEAYCRAGGMGKYQGGEDFYFLHKIFPLGETVEINTAKVYPAARLSDRVPFGTGPSLIKLVENNAEVKFTYPWKAFGWLRLFISEREKWYGLTASCILDRWQELVFSEDDAQPFPPVFLAYLKENKFAEALEELGNNCASLSVFSKRFFDIFTALRILQALNALQADYPLQPVAQETVCLLKEVYRCEIQDTDAAVLLGRMRKLQ